jgi:hypothetical protein
VSVPRLFIYLKKCKCIHGEGDVSKSLTTMHTTSLASEMVRGYTRQHNFTKTNPEWPVSFKTIVILDEVYCFQSAGANGKDYSFLGIKRPLLKFRKLCLTVNKFTFE